MSVSGRATRIVATLGFIVASTFGAIAATSVTASTTDGPHYQEPRVGQCHNYGWAVYAAPSDPSAVIPCSNAHTALVLATAQVPSTVAWTDMEGIYRAIAPACEPAFAKKLGRTAIKRAMSAYSMAMFIPTQAQRDHGARWARCDLVLPTSTSLLKLPKSSTPVLPSTKLTKQIKSCLTGTNRVKTTCSRAHNFRATGAVILSGAYPGDDRMLEIATNKCPRLTSTRAWYAYWSGPIAWKAGDKHITCYSRLST